MPDHELHKKVAEVIESIIIPSSRYIVEKDPACGGDKHVPFFLSANAHNDTEITNVDLVIIDKEQGKVKLVCEIEESDITPIRTFGKVFTAAAAEMCQLSDGIRYDLDENGIFIQVLSKRKLQKASRKEAQGKNIEDSLNALLKKSCSWIKNYHLMYGNKNEFEPGKSLFIKSENILNALI